MAEKRKKIDEKLVSRMLDYNPADYLSKEDGELLRQVRDAQERAESIAGAEVSGDGGILEPEIYRDAYRQTILALLRVCSDVSDAVNTVDMEALADDMLAGMEDAPPALWSAMLFEVVTKCEDLETKAAEYFAHEFRDHPAEVLVALEHTAREMIGERGTFIAGRMEETGCTRAELEIFDAPGSAVPHSVMQLNYRLRFSDSALESEIQFEARRMFLALNLAGEEWRQEGTDLVAGLIASKWDVTPEQAAPGSSSRLRKSDGYAAPPHPEKRFESTTQLLKVIFQPGPDHVRAVRGDTVRFSSGKGACTNVRLSFQDPKLENVELAAGSSWPSTVTPSGLANLNPFHGALLAPIYSYIYDLEQRGKTFDPKDAILPVSWILRNAMPSGTAYKTISEEQLRFTREGLLLLSATRMGIDCELYRRITGDDSIRGTFRWSNFVDLDPVYESINGKKVDCVQITLVPFPYRYTMALQQLEAVPVEMLGDVPLSSTQSNLALYQYLLSRVITVTRNKRLISAKVVSDDDIYAATGATTKKERYDVRKQTEKLLNGWQGRKRGGTGLFSDWIPDRGGDRRGIILEPTAKQRAEVEAHKRDK